MPKTPDQLFAILDGLGIKHSTVKHPPLFTVEQSRTLRGQIPGGHTKNLFLRDKKHVIYEGGHVFPFARVIKDTLDWLDRYLGVPR